MISLSQLYRLPRNGTDNPNGWVEPTSHCQLKCKGCYRGLDTGVIKPYHLPLEILQKQIDKFIANRNVQTISIAGGEPLLYPQITELISYISGKGLCSKIYTNGMSLNHKTLTEYKQAGATEFVIHVSSEQDRPGYRGQDEIQLMKVRQKYVDLFREIGGVNLGFIMPMFYDNLQYTQQMMYFCRENIDVVNLLVFTLWKESWKEGDNNQVISLEGLVEEMQKTGYIPSAYLPKTKDKSKVSRLLSLGFGNRNTYLGDINHHGYKLVSNKNRNYTNKYFITKKSILLSFAKIRKLILVGSGLKTICKTLLSPQHRSQLYYQSILIIDPPDGVGDWCEGCPDMMYIGEKLYPSCMINHYQPFKTAYIKGEGDT